MKSEHIETFIAIAQYGNISKAAEKLYVSQPTLSHRLTELENELGVTLFKRQKGVRNIKLTEHGHAFLTISDDWKSLLAATKKLTQIRPRENLRITVTHTVANSFFVDVLKLFSARNLPVNLHVMTSSSNDAFRKVQNDEIDFAVIGNTINFAGVVAEALAREKIVFVSGVNSIYDDFVRVKDLNCSNEVYINWGHDQLLWHQNWFGPDFLPVLRIESTPVAEGFFSGFNPQLWMPVAYSAARVMEGHKIIKISELDHPIPSREIYLISKIPIKQTYHDYLLADIKSVLNQNEGFIMVEE